MTRGKKPDSVQAADQLAAIKTLLKAWGVIHFAASMFWILQKTVSKATGVETSRTVPFWMNPIQSDLYSNLARNNRVLKARQAGITTFFLLIRLLLNIISEGGKTGLLVSQNSTYAAWHFQIARRAYRLIGAVDPYDATKNDWCHQLKANLLHTEYSNRKELVFDMLDSKLVIESAEVSEAAQGLTVHHGVGSEVARWPGQPEETISNIKGSIVPGGTWDEESTANGMGGYFCEQYLASMDDEKKADARSHFYGWWWSSEYDELTLTPAQRKELEDDLTATELAIIRKIHKELDCVKAA